MNDIDAWTNDIHQGDAAETLGDMPEDSVHCAVTSPPYFGLRDYGMDGQIGLEESLDEYIGNLVEVGDELRRVLRPDGSWWLNLGDSFAGSGRGQWDESDDAPKESYQPDSGELPDQDAGLRRKSKVLVPHRVAIALQESGWIVRSDAVWSKPNPMPHPVKDRLNETKEFVFHLTPNPDYWFDLDAIREPHTTDDPRVGGGKRWESDTEKEKTGQQKSFASVHPNGKNPGDVFDVTVKPFPEAHFAVYPPELCETPIKSSCPPKVCAECGMPYDRATEEVPVWERDRSTIERPQLKRALEKAEDAGLTDEHFEAFRAVGFSDAGAGKECQTGAGNNDDHVEELAAEAKEVLGGYFREFCSPAQKPTGWTQQCGCETDETESGIVLDPFAGAGTTARVAKDYGRRFIGVDLNPDYVALAQKRAGISVDEPERLLEDGDTPIAAFLDD